MSFLLNYGFAKFKDLKNQLSQAIVQFDPEAATEVAITEIEQKFDQLNIEFSKAKQLWQKENDEYISMRALFDKRLRAAELIKDDASKAGFLEQLIKALETMKPDIDVEKEEADEAKAYMDELETLVNSYSEKLKTARATVEKARREMERAKLKQKQAQERVDTAKAANGLTADNSSLSSALNHMKELTKAAEASTDANLRKAKLLGEGSDEIDASVNDILSSTGTEDAGLTNKTLTERLAALSK